MKALLPHLHLRLLLLRRCWARSLAPPSCLRPSTSSPGSGVLGARAEHWEQGRVPRGGPLSESRGSKEQAATASSRPWRSEVVPSRQRGPRGELGDAETFTAGRAGRVHGYAPRLRLPRPLSLPPRARAAAAVRPRAARGQMLQALRGFLGGSHACAPQPASGRRGQPRLCGSALWSPSSTWEICCRIRHAHFPRIREDRRERAKDQRERLSQEVISAPSELALWL